MTNLQKNDNFAQNNRTSNLKNSFHPNPSSKLQLSRETNQQKTEITSKYHNI